MKLALLTLALLGAGEQDWPSFRGPGAAGVQEGHPTAIEFDVDLDENVKWRTPIPGLAHSSPVVWGDRIFVVTAVAEGEQVLAEVGSERTQGYGDVWSVPDEGVHQFRTLALDKHTGEVLWDVLSIETTPKFKRHPKSSFAASTPTVDAERVIAFFGTEGMYCYDHDGELLWKRDLGDLNGAFFLAPTAEWGYSSSPVLHDGRVIVLCDVMEGSFLAALDAETGEDIWRTERDDVPTWGTPTVIEGLDRDQVAVNGFKHMGGYDLETGEELWRMSGGGDIPVPTPVALEDLVFFTSSHGPQAPIFAVDTMAEGDLSDEEGDGADFVAWSKPRRGGNYMTTPIVYDKLLYLCSDGGILTCLDAWSGEEQYRKRLGTGGAGFSSSPVAATST
jgi:hypothetical protein